MVTRVSNLGYLGAANGTEGALRADAEAAWDELDDKPGAGPSIAPALAPAASAKPSPGLAPALSPTPAPAPAPVARPQFVRQPVPPPAARCGFLCKYGMWAGIGAAVLLGGLAIAVASKSKKGSKGSKDGKNYADAQADVKAEFRDNRGSGQPVPENFRYAGLGAAPMPSRVTHWSKVSKRSKRRSRR